MKLTKAEREAAQADPSGVLLCAFCHGPKGAGYQGSNTCSYFCYRGEYGWLVDIMYHKRHVNTFRHRGWGDAT